MIDLADEEDEQLKQALALSLQEVQPHPDHSYSFTHNSNNSVCPLTSQQTVNINTNGKLLVNNNNINIGKLYNKNVDGGKFFLIHFFLSV